MLVNRLPGSQDEAVIDVASAITVTHSTGTHTVQSLTIYEPFTLSGGTLIVTGKLIQQNGTTFTITNGRLREGSLVTSGGAVLNVLASTLDGVTLGTTVSGTRLPATVQGTSGVFFVTGGLTLTNGSLLDLGNFMNHGTIRADAGGEILVAGNPGTTFTNATTGVLTAAGGTLIVNTTTNYAVDLNGQNGSLMTMPARTAVANRIVFNFGIQGIGGNRNTNAGDGYYELGIDLDGNGSFESKKYFHRLLGDVNGDGIVSSTDKSQVLSASGSASPESDVNGDGLVNILDTSLLSRAVGRKLKGGLFRDD